VGICFVSVSLFSGVMRKKFLGGLIEMNKVCNDVRVVGVERLGEPVHSSNRAVWITPFRFDKIRLVRDSKGMVAQEIPFSQFLWRVFILGKTFWPLSDDSAEAEVVDCGVVGGV